MSIPSAALNTLHSMHRTKTRPNRLRQLRDERGEKLYDLAVLVRRDTSVITRYENGDTAIPLDALKLLTEYYGVTAEYLLGWDREAA